MPGVLALPVMLRPPRILVLLPLLLAAACDQSFEPLEESHRSLSIFGYLDPDRTIQWIRVTPKRPSIFTAPEPSGATVSLRDRATGRTIELRDSLFEYPHNQEVGAEGVYLYNYWTADAIERGAVYDFKVEHPGGFTSEAVIPVPRDYSVSVAHGQTFGQRDELRISGVAHLAFVEMYTDVLDDCKLWQYRRRLEIPEGSQDPHVVIPFKFVHSVANCGTGVLQRRELWIAATEAPWPRGLAFSAGALNVSETPTNLSNAVGFVGAVLTRLVPYEECTLLGPGPLPHCVLSYDPGIASLRGSVRDACSNRGLAEAIVQLEELTPDFGGYRKRRPATSRSNGMYEISALDGGMRYALRVTHHARVPGATAPLYLEHADTLELLSGEVRGFDVELHRTVPC